MVRAAVSGAIDYSRADPTDINWRLRQKLVLQEVQRREEVIFLDAVHRQWLAYVSHGSLTDKSFGDVKASANDALDRLQNAIFPWIETPKPGPQNDTILDEETQKLVDQYKNLQAEFKNSLSKEDTKPEE
ncbi:hypothetical protein EBZ39_00260 [bacterium]|nr:hypothetical protein [bacterium]